MKQNSRRAKGKKLQRIVRDKLLSAFPHLYTGDIKVAKVGQQGEDLKLSRIARRLIPYQFEMKNQEKFKTIYSFWDQSVRHGKYEPVLVIKQNTRRALAVIDLDQFICRPPNRPSNNYLKWTTKLKAEANKN